MDSYFALQNQDVEYKRALNENKNVIHVPHYYPKVTKKLEGLPCGGGHSSFHVNWKGELCPCIAFSASVHYCLLGKDFQEVWNHVRETMKSFKLPKECTDCKIKEFCVSCPGEKCTSDMNGKLNKTVCDKLERYLNNRGFISVKA